MKMNKKGTDKLYAEAVIDDILYDYHAQQIEFEPTDFNGAIVLTVEEANLLFKVIDGFFDLRLPTTKEIIALNKLKVRVKRIEQTEMQDEIK